MDTAWIPSRAISLELIEKSSSPATVEAARQLLHEYGEFVVSQPGSARFCYGSLEKEIAQLPTTFEGQGGGCLLARLGDAPAGFVAWRALPASVDTEAWEMKRLWVRPLARGVGLGRILTEAVIERAQTSERSAIYLDTVPETMGSAYRMYLELGFAPCAPYNDNSMEGITFLRKQFR
jgi:ribosomal protein S18 acetylase RimI-like enzyme